MSEANNQGAALLSVIPFFQHVGLTVSDDGAALLPESASLLNHVGTMHAGALFTLGEGASGLTALRDLGNLFGGGMVVTKEATIQYKKPARGALRAMGALEEPVADVLGRLEAEGKVTFTVGVSLTDASGLEIATMRVVWYARRATS